MTNRVKRNRWSTSTRYYYKIKVKYIKRRRRMCVHSYTKSKKFDTVRVDNTKREQIYLQEKAHVGNEYGVAQDSVG